METEKKIDSEAVKRTTPLRILVCGDRNWTDRATIENVLMEYLPETVVHGAARGADTIAGEIAKHLGCNVVQYAANWKEFGKRAGPIRNKAMLENSTPDLVLAFHSDIGRSKGTLNMVTIAAEAGIPTRVVRGKEDVA